MNSIDPLIPSENCDTCYRLSRFRNENRKKHPEWHNGPVATFGDPLASLLIVGLAPGLKGANRTGRPFTGDFAGELLYTALDRFGFSEGVFSADPSDTLVLRGVAITNAVRCVPPQNRPVAAEIKNCGMFLQRLILGLPRLQSILALGRIAHDSVLDQLAYPRKSAPFKHGAIHTPGRFVLHDSYHCSRYNTQTRRLTSEMFFDVFEAIQKERISPDLKI